MHRRSALEILVGLGVPTGLIVNCRGAQSPTQPSILQERSGSLTIQSLRTGKPIAGATVIVGSSSSITDEQGMVVLAAFEGVPISITAAGHTEPRIVPWTPNTVEWLLPNDREMPVSWIREALYRSLDDQWLWRPNSGDFLIVPSQTVFNDGFAMDGIRNGVARINMVHRHVRFVVGRPDQQSDRAVQITHKPSLPWFAATSIACQGATIVGATIEYSTFHLNGFDQQYQYEALVTATAHELAHVAGLSGHPRPIPGVYANGVMYGNIPHREFSQPEIDILNWMFRRMPGTRPVDDSTRGPEISTSGRTQTSWRVICHIDRSGNVDMKE